MKEVEIFIGPCSKYITGQGWTTEIPVEQIKAKGYQKENAELKKQVDELTKEKSKEVNDLVKEKVKEIFTRLAKRRHQGFDLGGFFVEYRLRLEDLNWIETYCGVEVE